MNYKHGYAKKGAVDPLHNRWRDIHKRCRHHKSYAGRGITICDEWQEFLPFREWALKSGYKPVLTLDRIDNDGPYSPENCRWTSARLQARNRRTSKYLIAFGERKTLAEWAEQFGISQCTLWQRLNTLKWSNEDAISKPVKTQSLSS